MFVSVSLAFLAAATAPATPAPTATATPVKEKLICRTEAAATGSITGKRVCKTKAEWVASSVRGQTPADLQRSTPTRPIGR